MDDSAITCDEIIDAEAFPTNFNEKNITCKIKFPYFTTCFINYHCLIDSC